MAKTAEEIHQAWLTAMQSQSTKNRYKAGIEKFSGNPMQLAADADQLYLRQVTAAVESGYRRNKLLAVPVSRWKNNALGTGADRLASGALKGAEKQRAAAVKFAPVYAEAAQAAAAIPKDGTEASALARVAVVMQILKRAAGRVA